MVVIKNFDSESARHCRQADLGHEGLCAEAYQNICSLSLPQMKQLLNFLGRQYQPRRPAGRSTQRYRNHRTGTLGLAAIWKNENATIPMMSNHHRSRDLFIIAETIPAPTCSTKSCLGPIADRRDRSQTVHAGCRMQDAGARPRLHSEKTLSHILHETTKC